MTYSLSEFLPEPAGDEDIAVWLERAATAVDLPGVDELLERDADSFDIDCLAGALAAGLQDSPANGAPTRPFVVLAPTMPISEELELDAIDAVRVRNLLGRARVTNWSRMATLSVAEFQTFPNAGPESTRSLATHVFRVALSERPPVKRRLPKSPQPGHKTPPTVKRQLDDLAREIGERELAIFGRRHWSEHPRPSYESLAPDFELVRERVRQIAVAVELRLTAVRATAESTPAGAAAMRLRKRLRALADREYFTDALREAAGDGLTRRQSNLLLSIAGPYRRRDTWLVLDGAFESITSALDDLTLEGPAPLDRALQMICDHDVGETSAGLWIERSDTLRVVEGKVIRWKGSQLDRAVSFLEATQRAATPSALSREIGSAGRRSATSRFAADPRFARVSVSEIGLRSWGRPEYPGIRTLLYRAIEEAEGEADFVRIRDELVDAWGVSPSSIHQWASSAEFERSSGGGIRVRRDDPPRRRHRSIARTRHCLATEVGGALAIPVNHEVLDGSGTRMPPVLAARLGVPPGGNRRFGRLTIRDNGLRPVLSTLRTLAIECEAREGDSLLLKFGRGGTVAHLLVRARELEGRDPLAVAAARYGLQGQDADAVVACLAAGMELSEGSRSAADVLEWLKRRGET